MLQKFLQPTRLHERMTLLFATVKTCGLSIFLFIVFKDTLFILLHRKEHQAFKPHMQSKYVQKVRLTYVK